MTTYRLLFILICLLGPLEYKFRDSKYFKAIACCIFAGIFAVVSAIRLNQGWDYYAYLRIYFETAFKQGDIYSISRLENGYLFLNKLISLTVADSKWIFIVVALITACCVALYLFTTSENIFWGFMGFLGFGFFYNSMNYLRQIIAALIIMFALKCIEKKQPLHFIILICFASTFHISALCMLPCYWILRIPLNKFTVPLFTITSAVIYFNSFNIFKLTFGLMKGVDLELNKQFTSGIPILYPIIFTSLLILTLIFMKDIKDKPHRKILISALFWGTMIEWIGHHHAYISRMALNFLLPSTIIILGDVVDAVQIRLKGYLKQKVGVFTLGEIIGVIFIMAVLCGIWLLQSYMYTHNYNGVMPYSSYWKGWPF